MEIGERLDRARQRVGLSRAELAQRAGMARSSVSDILNGKQQPSYKTVERLPIRADYRGWQILGPPPPAASGVHIAQMLNILEGYDITALGFGSPETIHYLAEVLKIAFADRAAASGDPDFVGVPVERLTSKHYADERRRAIDPKRAQRWGAGVQQLESWRQRIGRGPSEQTPRPDKTEQVETAGDHDCR